MAKIAIHRRPWAGTKGKGQISGWALVSPQWAKILRPFALRHLTEGHVAVSIGGKSWALANVIAGGKPPRGFVVDHLNGNPLDNREENLEVVTHAENVRRAKQSP